MERVRLRYGDDDLRLPDDLLADVLGRLPPRYLAVSRCVRKAWRRVVDERRLLRADLLPLSLAGIFIQFECHGYPEFFSRPTSAARGTANTKLDFLPPAEYPFGEISDGFDEDYFVQDHCNGLLLTSKYVVNPATRCWNPLSAPPGRPSTDPASINWFYNKFLSFDPTVSPHYQVFSIPSLCPQTTKQYVDPVVEKSEWPPCTWILNVFSSMSGRWEQRPFAREGKSAGSVSNARPPSSGWPQCHTSYWRQALYVHCQTNLIVRISLSDDKYRVIKPPIKIYTRARLGRSRDGVYYVSFIKYDAFRVWILDESSHGQIKWTPKGEYDLKRVQAIDQHVHGPWVLEDINYELFRSQFPQDNEKEIAAENFEWNSDIDDVDNDNKEMAGERHRHGCEILGFHPYKEILFLSSFKQQEWRATVHAYHLNTSRVECLGNMRPAHYDLFEGTTPCQVRDYTYFPYTPCLIDEFPSTIQM